jgi:hypothetical protein
MAVRRRRPSVNAISFRSADAAEGNRNTQREALDAARRMRDTRARAQRDVLTRLSRDMSLARRRLEDVNNPASVRSEFVYSEVPLGFNEKTLTPVYGEVMRDGRKVTEQVGWTIDPSMMPMSPLEQNIENRYLAITRGAPVRAGDETLVRDTQRFMQDGDYLGPEEKYLTESDALRQLQMASVEQLAEIKNNLIASGYLDPDKAGVFSLKQITPAVEDGFLLLVYDAQSNDMRWSAFMNKMIQSGERASYGGSRGGGGGGGGGTIRLTNPDNLREIANQVAQQKIGRRLDDESLNRFVQAYQDAERQFQSAYLAGTAEITEAPTPDVFAQTQIGQMFESEEDLYSLGSTLDMFTQIVGGAAG